MGLSYDLISEFVKITNDKKEGAKEGTVYATVVNSTGGKYVKIDGSDLLTPIDTTTGIDDGERVTVMIKDHKATVTGNITSPSVGTNKFDSLVGTIVDANLGGINADIENLIAKNAYLENVFAQNSILIDSKIENLVAKDSYLENTYAENSTIIDSKIENLEATDSRIENSVIENFQVIDGVVQDLKATNADIKILNSDFAQIKTLVNGNLTSDNILSFILTSEKVTVDDAFIKDAMIDTISAGKINSGKINTNFVSIGSEDGGMLITGSTQQFTDKNGNVRIQIGKDASGDFTFILYGEDGTGQLINQNGITASAIGDGLIVNDMVSDNAAISGGKLDISSVITEINSDNSTTIKSSKIYLNDQAQSLEVAFNSLKTKVDTIQEVTIQGDLTAIVEQVQSNTSKIEANRDNISTLISENTVVKKQVTDLQGTVSKTESTLTSKYTSLNQNLEGFKTTVADTYATKSSVTDVVDNIEANYSTTSVMNSAIEQKAQEISASVSTTYATKNQVNTLDNTLKKNYSTTKQMESAINVAKEEINLGVSSIYETKEDTTSKINDAVNTAKNDAIKSANNTLTTTIANYYTKSQTDSQIKVAKEAINLGVSTSYETKENVQTKVTSTLNSAKSYADTKKKEAISTAASDATSKANTAKQEAISSANNTLKSTIANYYTKSQTDSQIKVAKEEINLGVSTNYETKTNVETKINNLSISGVNRVLNSGISQSKTLTSAVNETWTPYMISGDIRNQKVTVAFDYVATNIVKQTDYGIKFQTTYKLSDDTTAWYPSYGFKLEDGDSSGTIVLPPITFDDIKAGNNAEFRFRFDKVSGTIKISKARVFIGEKDLGWSLAPEDIDKNISTAKSEAISTAASDATSKANTAKNDAIKSANNTLTTTIANYYTKSQTDSQIKVAKEAINLGVSTSYETKENVQTKVTSTLNSAKSYADTKKKEAISTAASDATSKANTAKNDAIKSASSDATSKVDAAKKELNTSINKKANSSDVYTKSEVYTKSQTDSQIKVAKEAINLGVSNTYETKTNVTSKINGIEVGARNLVDHSKLLTNVTGSNEWKVAETGDEGFKKLAIDTTSTGWIECQIPLYTEIYTITRKVTVSFEYQETSAGSLMFSLGAYDGDKRLSETSNVTVSSAFKVISNIGGWKYVSYTFDPTSVNSAENATNYRIQFKKSSGLTGKIHIRKPKIEFGTKPTSWSPAPEDISNDMESEFSSIKSETKSLKQTVSSLALGADSISASVKSLEETMTNTTNGLASDISKVQEQVNLAMTSSDVKLEIQKELKNGVKKVSTSTGFTFDDKGLKINKSDSEMNTQITEDGMKIYKNSEVMLTANNQGVDAKNLHATTYLIIGGNSRMEDFTENGSKRTAVFWIG